MSLMDRARVLKTPEEVDGFLREHPDSALFKLGTCHVTDKAFVHVRACLEPREDVPLALLHVVKARPASNHVAALTGVRHESPQLFFFRAGQPVFDRNNWGITAEAIGEALRTHFAPATSEA